MLNPDGTHNKLFFAASVLILSGSGCLQIVGSSGDSSGPPPAPMQQGCARYASSWTPVNTDPTGAFLDFQEIVTSAAGDIFSGPEYFSNGSDWKVAELSHTFASVPAASVNSTDWTIADQVTPSGTEGGGYTADGFTDSLGNLFFVGGSFDTSSNNLHWWTRRSTNGGAAWSLADNYSGADIGGTTAGASGISSDSSGNIYVAGSVGGYPTATGVLRRSTDHGATWSTVLHYQYAVGHETLVFSTLQLPSGAVLALASGMDASGVYHGLVFRSLDSGVTFSLLTDYEPVAGKNSIFEQMTLDSKGNLLVVMTQVGAASSDAYWQVLKSVDGGLTFNTVDNYVLATGQGLYDVYPVMFFRDAGGTLYVPGYAQDSTGSAHAIIRRSTDDGATWSLMLDYVDSSVGYGVFYGMGADARNNLYASGYGANGLVMRLDCQD